ncbi:2-nitropropane dioxygenase NPD [Zymomonas mobilis subsp. mobilis NCIMB 11163]|uniref:nitronate monooxygenase n=1 Tax=Zymomonas mobilis TaxID=542 RepID=UPI0001B7062C|nr:nitronate monooxygenase [Zymomonas mobilis]ACV75844.1 2-nitropropane dioxygenase NPD [Zymomonas mobilis subsp. mobilis NCIMB 11163]
MEYKNSRLSAILKIQYPLIQAPMSWITNADFVAAVSEAGGLGVLGPHAGYHTPPKDPQEILDRVRLEIRKVKSLTDKPFGLNLLLLKDDPLDDFTKAWLNIAFEEGVTHFVSVGNADNRVFNLIKEHDGIIIHRPLTASITNMREAESLGADVLVATGYDEGGMIPTRAIGTFTIVPTMVDAVDIPVMATGGINDRRGVKAAFALGAEGVYIGTRFIVTKENPASEITKKKIVESGCDDIEFVSPKQRSIRTQAADILGSLYLNKENTLDLDTEISRLGGVRPAMLEGKLDEGIISVNTGIDVIRSMPTVKELVIELLGLNEE